MLRHGSVALETFVPARGSVTIETLDAGEVRRLVVALPALPLALRRAGALARARDELRRRLPARQDARPIPQLGYDLMSRFAQVVIERLQSTRLRLLDMYGYAGD